MLQALMHLIGTSVWAIWAVLSNNFGQSFFSSRYRFCVFRLIIWDSVMYKTDGGTYRGLEVAGSDKVYVHAGSSFFCLQESDSRPWVFGHLLFVLIGRLK